jgi:hypothetical protein
MCTVCKHFLKEQGPTCWSKFDKLLSLIKNIIMGGPNQLDLFMKKNSIFTFIDFMLGPQSPYVQPDERRTKMGGMYGSPNFKDLLEAISYMIMHCYTSTYTPGTENHPPCPEKGGYQILYDLDELIGNDLILHPEFLKIAIKNVSDYLGYAFAHLSFNNHSVSKAVAEQLLKQINDTDFNKIEACMGFAKPFLSI